MEKLRCSVQSSTTLLDWLNFSGVLTDYDDDDHDDDDDDDYDDDDEDDDDDAEISLLKEFKRFRQFVEIRGEKLDFSMIELFSQLLHCPTTTTTTTLLRMVEAGVCRGHCSLEQVMQEMKEMNEMQETQEMQEIQEMQEMQEIQERKVTMPLSQPCSCRGNLSVHRRNVSTMASPVVIMFEGFHHAVYQVVC